MTTISELFDLAKRNHQIGNLQQADALCRRVLEADPAHAAAYHLLGLVAHQAGRHPEAITFLRQAIALDPADASCPYNLATVFINLGLRAEAIACYRQVLRLEPHHDPALNNLGNALREQGQLAEAAECFRQALRVNPRNANGFFNLGTVLKAQGQLAEAALCYRQALAIHPDDAAAHNNLGLVLAVQGQLAEAVECFRQALRVDPRYVDAHYNLGTALKDLGQWGAAAECFREAARLNPQHAGAQNSLGSVLQVQGQLGQAADCYRQALRIDPRCADAHNNLGIVRVEQGQLDEALACYRQAQAIAPENAGYQSNLLYCLLYHPAYDSAAIYQEHRRWHERHAQPLEPMIRPHANDRSPERRLRIGYISPDFRNHCQAFFTLPLFGAHDHGNYELCCYADVKIPDAITGRLRACADLWRNIRGLGDERVASMIREDRIDILVDLTMHMSGGRLLVFARKPAPIQACWLAYPGTTGLTAIDYRLSDPQLDPPELDNDHYSEETVRLPKTFWCYDPLTSVPAVNALPARKNGHVTFGCFNNFCKVSDNTLKLWAQVLRGVRTSHLILSAPEGRPRNRVMDTLKQEGIDSERIRFVARQPRPAYLELYHQVDIGLDTLPYNGHTTSLDSLWMGVPVITLVGQTVVGRAGLSQLTNLGLEELAAKAPDDFVRLAVDLAGDLPRLQSLRDSLRERMRKSPLMDAVGFARGIERAYRDIWHTWCGELKY